MIDYKEKLAELKSTKQALEDDLKLTKIDITNLVMAECLKIHKVKPGSIIRGGGKNGEEFKVIRVFPYESQDQPSLRGVKKKKNGEWGIQERHVWSYLDHWILVSE